MATATVQPLLPNQAMPVPAAAAATLLPGPPVEAHQTARANLVSLPAAAPPPSPNWVLPATGGLLHGAAAAPPPVSGMPLAVATSSVTASVSAPVNWSLPANQETVPSSVANRPVVNWSPPAQSNTFPHGATAANQPGATPPQETVPSSVANPPPVNWSLPAKSNTFPHGATTAQESRPSLGEAAASSIAAGLKAPVNWSLPVATTSAGMTPVARPAGAGTSKWGLLPKLLKVAELPVQDGCIWRLDGASLPPGACTPMVVFLGPLFPMMDQAQQGMEETKWKYVHNLIRRAHAKEDAEKKLTEYLARVETLEGSIRQRYDPSECQIPGEKLVEMMVVDGLFVIEVLINHWLGKIDRGSASPQAGTASESSKADLTTPLAAAMVPQALREDFTPLKVRWEPYALRFDLVAVPNQIPFFVLEELFKMTEIPELRELEKKPTKLRQIILDYLVGDAGDHVLAGYEGPVYHILHLVYLYLTFSKDEPKASALQPKPAVTRSLSVDTALGKLKQKSMDLRALYRRTVSRSSSLPVGWRQWKVIPPLRELVRVGVKLKRAETPRFAEVRFKNGTLEIPTFAWRRYHIRLLTNLVVLEMSGWWPPEKRLFCSYVRFMAELVMKKEDAALLFKKGVVQENNVDDVEKSLICPFLILADFSHGSKYECHFDGLVRDMVRCYERWSKVGAVPSSSSQ